MEDLYLPFVRCPTCNKVIGNLHSKYLEMLKQGVTPEMALNELGLKRYCCRFRIIEAPMIGEGFLVENEIEKIQERTGKLYIETGKRTNMKAITNAMRNEDKIKMKEQEPEPKLVRIVPTTIGRIRRVAKR
jgi:DNA-directed RNA polymerase subunit N (RpoN/RPB10)